MTNSSAISRVLSLWLALSFGCPCKTATAPSLLPAILLIASMFNDLRNGHSVDQRLSWHEALQQMTAAVPNILDADLLGYFMDTLGLYPLDCIVELNSGELGWVVEVDQQNPKQPVLRVVTDTQKQLIEPAFVFRLADPVAKKYSIVRVLPVDEPILDLLLIHQGQVDA